MGSRGTSTPAAGSPASRMSSTCEATAEICSDLSPRATPKSEAAHGCGTIGRLELDGGLLEKERGWQINAAHAASISRHIGSTPTGAHSMSTWHAMATMSASGSRATWQGAGVVATLTIAGIGPPPAGAAATGAILKRRCGRGPDVGSGGGGGSTSSETIMAVDVGEGSEAAC
jgi:hypothetical protein